MAATLPLRRSRHRTPLPFLFAATRLLFIATRAVGGGLATVAICFTPTPGTVRSIRVEPARRHLDRGQAQAHMISGGRSPGRDGAAVVTVHPQSGTEPWGVVTRGRHDLPAALSRRPGGASAPITGREAW